MTNTVTQPTNILRAVTTKGESPLAQRMSTGVVEKRVTASAT